MGKTKPPATSPAAAPFHNPFGGLGAKLGMAPAPAAPASAVPAPQPAKRGGPARAVVRLERKGRGGKEATIVEKLGLSDRELETWLGELKRALGCGGHLEDGALVLHGDLRPRLKAWLEGRGVGKVTLG